MDYNGHQDEEYESFSLGAFASQYHCIDGYGPEDEDVCVHGTPGFLPDDVSSDVIVFVRRSLPKPQQVAILLAITLRAEEGLE